MVEQTQLHRRETSFSGSERRYTCFNGREEVIFGLENRDYGRRGSAALTLYPQKLALTSPTSGCRSAGMVRSWTKATGLVGWEEVIL
jgi:hypothetical protein